MRKEKQKVARLRNCSFIRRGLGKLTCSLKIGLGTLRAGGLEREFNVEADAVTAFRSLLDIDWIAPPRQDALGMARRRDGGRMSISLEHSPRVPKMVPSLCRTSKISHEGRWRDSCVSTRRDSYRSWLHRFVRLRFHYSYSATVYPAAWISSTEAGVKSLVWWPHFGQTQPGSSRPP